MDEFQTNHLNNEEFIEIHLITWSPLRKGQTAGGHVIQMALFLGQIWFSFFFFFYIKNIFIFFFLRIFLFFFFFFKLILFYF